MSFEEIRCYCLSKKGVEEDTLTFDDRIVYRLWGKKLVWLSPQYVSVILSPENSRKAREQHDCVTPSIGKNKHYWSDVDIAASNSALLKVMIDMSYSYIMNRLPVVIRNNIRNATDL